MTKLREAIDLAQRATEGNCSICELDGPPSHDGYHHHAGKAYDCGNLVTCTLCHGCLPPGEVCQACGRKNIDAVEA